MGIRFRRSIKIAPGLKLNLNKKSVSLTAGKRGAHFTVNSKGKRTTSVGIPGTGLSYVKTSGNSASAKKKNSSTNNMNSTEGKQMETSSNGGKKKGSCLPKVIAAFVIIGIIGAVLPDEKIESLSISIPDQQEEYDINTDIPVTIASDPEDADLNDLEYQTSSSDITFSESGINTGSDEGTYEVYVKSDGITSNTLSINVVDFTARAEAEAEAQRLAEEQAQKEAEEQAAREAEEQAKREAEEKRLAEEQAEKEAAEKAEAIQVQDSSKTDISESASGSSDSAGNGDNFNTYDNAEQQQTTASYVLNTNTHKFHYPSCRSVKKISPENYSTSNGSRDEIISQGYDPCGICKP